MSFDVFDGELEISLNSKFKDNKITFNNLTDYKWIFKVDGFEISYSDVIGLAEKDEAIFKINDYLLFFSKENIQSIKSNLNVILKDFTKNQLLHYSFLNKSGNLSFDIDDKLNSLLDTSTRFKPPEALKGTLRDYQEVGYSWLVHNIKSGFGCILADDMGLGKTIQTLTTILYLKQENLLEDEKVLIVAPTTLLSNWANEIKKFTPSLSYGISHGNDKYFDLDGIDVLITSFGVIRSDKTGFFNKDWFGIRIFL